MALAPHTRLGPYEIVSPLGAGGMGEVYRARDESLGRDVAVKVLPKEFASDDERLRRFEQEARAAAALNHPNVLAVYGFSTSEERTPYLVTELLQGQTLRERLQQGAIPVRKAIGFGLQAARGLAAAHARGIAHRDLKPENIFITDDGVVKILDFGLAKLVGRDTGEQNSAATAGITESGVVLGTVGYMSPEQVRGQTLDHRTDIFSLGAILYEMLSGRRAFQGETAADTMSAILKEEPAELSGSGRNLPPALGHIVHRCLEKDPAERFQSARDLAFNLELVGREESGSGAATLPALTKDRTWPIATLVALAILAAAGLALIVPVLRSRAKESLPIEVMRLTDFVGMEEFPALSPDGKSLAFTADVSGQRQVCVRLLSGGAPLQVTHDDADHQYPRWSSDSSSLIYFSPSQQPGGQGKIWQIPALGGAARPLLNSLGGADLSHDGKHIAYFQSNSQGELSLAVADADGSNARALTTLPAEYNYSDLRWSPDDRKLGFQRGRTFDYDIFYAPVEGGSVQAITHDGNPLEGFAWLPDGSGVVYSSSRGDTVLYLRSMNLWSVQTGGKNLRQLTFGETSYISPDLDQHGNLVATRRQIQFDIWRYPVDGKPEENVRRGVQITHQTGKVQTPSPGPGDHELVYLSDSGGHGNLWVINLDTGQNRQVTFEHDPKVTVGVPVWSPDGKYIAYVKRGRTAWNVDLWLMNPDGSDSHKVSDGGGWACWSSDSRWLYFSPPSQNGFRIEKASVPGGQNQVVREEGQKPAVDKEGRLFFVLSLPALNGLSDMEILVAKPENGAPQTVTRISGSHLSNWLLMQPVLSPDGKWLAALLTDGRTTDIWGQPTDGGAMRRITDFGRQATFITRRVSWSSDGRFVYAAVGKGEADIVLLSNLKP